MAILQISRITNRKGLYENLPQLAGGEIGWAIDERKLFIGNGTTEDGAPVVGNTEILTQFSDLTVLSEYTYSDIAVGYSAQTGETPSSPIVRTVQTKLDDTASVRDFGAVGNGVTDDTDAINRALYQLFCVNSNSQIRRSLFFPAGTYLVTDTIKIPPYAKLVGEGADSSTIVMTTGAAAVPEFVASFSDDEQNTSSINPGAVMPRNIEINSMSFQTTDVRHVFSVQYAEQCTFENVNFIGPYTNSDIVDPGFDPVATDNKSCIQFNSTAQEICNQIIFDRCKFTGQTFAFKDSEGTQGITVSNSAFETLYQGVVLGTGTPSNGGPTGFRIVHNQFNDIYNEAIVFDDVEMNVSAYNAFYNVGNAIGAGTPVTPIISIVNDNNVSMGDMFQRTEADNNLKPRVSITGGATTSSGLNTLGRFQQENGKTLEIADNVTDSTLFTKNQVDVKAFIMYYTMVRGGEVRHGKFTVTSTTSGATYSDDYTETADIDVSLKAVTSSSTITVSATAGSTGSATALTYSITNLA